MAVAFGLDRDAIPGILVHPSNVPSEGVCVFHCRTGYLRFVAERSC